MTTSPRPRRPRAGLAVPPDDDFLVAVDVETTGLDPSADRIIEVGAVKFRHDRWGGPETVVAPPETTASAAADTFASLVNPEREVPPFVVTLTGITQAEVNAAPKFADIAPALREFIGGHPIVGHNVSFDAAFLRSHGIHVRGPAYDTFDLAFILLLDEQEFGLERLAARHAVAHDRPHRALSDALATRDLFLKLERRLGSLEPGVLSALSRYAPVPGWTVGALAGRHLAAHPARGAGPQLGPFGLDPAALGKRTRPLWTGKRQRSGAPDSQAYVATVKTAFAQGGAIETSLPGYEQRPQQHDMAAEVAAALANGGSTVIEAGTGVGKTLAYLVPAALHAASGGGPVIVSTNTINLQEQLLAKDLPAALAVLEKLGLNSVGLRAAQLKGRANYLCFRKWAFASQDTSPSEQDARVVAKCLLWLQQTSTGDRAEIGLGRDAPAFTRLSAQGAKGCPSPEGPCFLRKARAEADVADVIVINHSLLLSDVAMGGGLLPDHDALIIDEAHHLEAVATRHLGFQVTEAQVGTELTALLGEPSSAQGRARGLIARLAQIAQASGAAQALNAVPVAAAAAMTAATRGTERTGPFFKTLRSFAAGQATPGEEGADLRVTPATRAQPGWDGLEHAWERLDAPLGELLEAVNSMVTRIDAAGPPNEEAQAALLSVSAPIEALGLARAGLRQAVAEPRPDMVYWVSSGKGDWVAMNGAPLQVGPILREKLFKRERAVVLTGATLSADGGFDRFREAIGLDSGRELLLGSPFDYRQAALIAVPEDIPEPGSAGYAKAIAAAIASVALALRDRVLVLFTSNSALEAARRAIVPLLEPEGVRVVAQGTDGPPHRVMRALADTQACVALGASSLWEGVDMGGRRDTGNGGTSGPSIKALLMPRLPFPVPTDPIFAARSELHEDAFNDYAVPEAVLRFRQGFGRLIRSRSDRGAFVVLDRRILTKQYGVAFQRALPKCTVRRVTLAELGDVVEGWNSGEEP